MAKNENKTKLTDASVGDFIANITDEQQRKDSAKLVKIMSDITGEPPKMWGSSIIGFGQYHYKSKSGREGDWLTIGFSPRKDTLTLYLTYGIDDHKSYLDKLGKHKTGKGCLYIKKLSDTDSDVLEDLIKVAYQDMLNFSKQNS